MKNAIREEESACSETRPDKTPASPHCDQEWKPDDKRVGAVDRQRCQDESASRPEFANQVLGIGDEEITASEQIDAMLLELMQEVDDEQDPMGAHQAVALLLRPVLKQQ